MLLFYVLQNITSNIWREKLIYMQINLHLTEETE